MDTSARLAKRCCGRNHEGQMIGVDHHRKQTLVFRIVADHAEFKIAVDQLRRNFARKRPAHLHLHLGIKPPVTLDVAQQVERRGFVGAHDQPAGGIVAQLGQRVLQIGRQVLETPRVVIDDAASIGQQQLLARTVDQLLLQIRFKLLDRERDRGLGAQHLLSGAGEAFLATRQSGRP